MIWHQRREVRLFQFTASALSANTCSVFEVLPRFIQGHGNFWRSEEIGCVTVGKRDRKNGDTMPRGQPNGRDNEHEPELFRYHLLVPGPVEATDYQISLVPERMSLRQIPLSHFMEANLLKQGGALLAQTRIGGVDINELA